MPSKKPSPVAEELDHAVVDLLRAEVEFTKAYANWVSAPRDEQRALRKELDAWERRIEDAMHEAQKWQDAVRANDS